MEKDINKFVIISIVSVAIVAVIFIGAMIARTVNNSEESKFAEELSNYEEMDGEFESASTSIGKTVEEAEDDEQEYESATLIENEYLNTINSSEITNNIVTNQTNSKNSENESTEKTIPKQEEILSNQKEETSESDKKEEVKFEPPIKGEITMAFARESLVFSNTLQEWITHNGVDIKADKTSVVKAASAGTVYAIKNDPRYGLTVIINHDDDYQTVYSNLLTAEFVVEGENVEAGDTIGTVGNSATFEVSDESHLHFELLKNGEYLDPTIYMEFE